MSAVTTSARVDVSQPRAVERGTPRRSACPMSPVDRTRSRSRWSYLRRIRVVEAMPQSWPMTLTQQLSTEPIRRESPEARVEWRASLEIVARTRARKCRMSVWIAGFDRPGVGERVTYNPLLNTTPLRKLKNHPAACRWQVGRAEGRVEPFWGGHRHGRTDRIGNQTGVDSVPSHL